MKGLILAGGHGTRLRPLTHTGPKQLIPIANKPNILYCLEDILEANIKEIGVILGDHMPEKVKELLGDGSKYGCKITYIVQGEPKGIAHAVGCAEKFMGDEPFVVYLGDNILKSGIRRFAEEFEKSDAEASIALCRVDEPRRYGLAYLNEKGEVIKTVEKPKNPKSDLAVIGIYFFRKSIFEVIKNLKPSWRGEYEITDAIDALIRKGHKVQAHIVEGWWKDTGKAEDILQANHLVLDDLEPVNNGIMERDARINGRVSIGEGTVIRAGSYIKGPAVIGRHCEIGPDAYIGPYTSIGDHVKIVETEIEGSIILENSEISCGGKIVESLIGKHSIISSSKGKVPAGRRFIVGENTRMSI